MDAANPANLPYLTADLPGVGGRIKDRPEDFRVEELPLYQPCGEGTHVYFRIEKVGLPTPAAVDRIARYMGVRPGDIGVAGLKDSQAVASQMLSLEHVAPEKLAAYRDPQLRVTWTARHGNKLRRGHLAGNRFAVRLRGADVARIDDARAVLDVLARRGVPNYFGAQRFGARGDTAELGEALVRGDGAEFLARLLGRARPGDPPGCRAARDAFDAGYLDRALDRWPRGFAEQRRALSAYRKRRKASAAVAAVDKRIKRLYVSAFQSLMFNEVLVRRLNGIDRVMGGDLACKTDSGGVFLVEDADVEQPRAAAWEISPTAPIVGYRSRLAEGEPGRIEREVLAARAISPEDFRGGALSAKGTRRSLRFAVEDVAVTAGEDQHGPYLELRFTAPPGCYATVLLREVVKDGR